MNTGLSSILGWGALTIGVGGAFFVVRRQINQRRQEQEARGVRTSQIMTWEEKVLEMEQRAKDNIMDKKDKHFDAEQDEKRAARDEPATAESKPQKGWSAAHHKAAVAVGKKNE